MPGSYMPDKLADQVQWAQNFVAVVQPEAVLYGIPTPTMSNFAGVVADLVAAWTVSQNETTRTKVSVNERDTLLKEMKKQARQLVSIIQGTPTVTEAMLIAAGLTVRKTHPSPIPAPSQSPFIKIKGTNGRVVTVQLQQDAERRAKPAGVAGATIFTYEGPTPPMDAADWKFYANVSRPVTAIDFGASATGGTVWITAFWKNAKDQSGPAANPVSINLPSGGILPAEADQAPVRIAA